MATQIDEHIENHYINRSNWLRASVLGANDGILSVASIAIGVASAGETANSIVLASVAGLVAGAFSMAAGEYVSVSSQTDIEQADIERERIELEEMPEIELQRLAQIYQDRGLSKETAMLVAKELTAKDALAAHVRDELGINEMTKAKPLQAAFASLVSFIFGGILPVIIVILFAGDSLTYWLYGFSTIFLALLGGISAKTGGANVLRAIIRITFWGTVAMGVSSLIGYIFDVNI